MHNFVRIIARFWLMRHSIVFARPVVMDVPSIVKQIQYFHSRHYKTTSGILSIILTLHIKAKCIVLATRWWAMKNFSNGYWIHKSCMSSQSPDESLVVRNHAIFVWKWWYRTTNIHRDAPENSPIETLMYNSSL